MRAIDSFKAGCEVSGRDEYFAGDGCKLGKWPANPNPNLPGAWVLSYPRTGSYYLCSMLNALGLSPPVDEWYLPERHHLVERIPKNSKVQPLQFEQSGVTLDEVIAKRPDTRFILLRRRDLVACAVSLYLAYRTGFWRVTSDEQADRLKRAKPIVFDRDRLMAIYDRCVEYDKHWPDKLDTLRVAYHEVIYEDLVASPEANLAKVLTYLDLEADPAWCVAASPNRKQSVYQTEYNEYCEKLRALVDSRLSIMAPTQMPRTPQALEKNHFARGIEKPPGQSRLVVGALSCLNSAYSGRRLKCQTAWLDELEYLGAEVLFLVGTGRTDHAPRLVRQEGHGRVGTELQLPCPDDYASLPQKTYWFCRWACESRRFDYLFKCDDDTYIVPQRLMAMIQGLPDGTDYVGNEWKPGVRYASGGAGYLLSHHSAMVVAGMSEEGSAGLIQPQGAEDLLVGRLLSENGIGLTPEPRLIPFASEQVRPTPNNDLITAHACEVPWAKHEQTWRADQPVGTRNDVTKSKPGSLRETFDRIVCINLKRRPDRWEQFSQQFTAEDWPFRKPDRFEATDASLASPPACWGAPSGAWGCYRSHLRVLEEALTDGVESLLIFEDDALLAENFAARVTAFLNEVPNDWGGLMLGGRHRDTPQMVTPGVVRAKRVHRTHAFALRGETIHRLYQHLSDYVMLAGPVHPQVDWLLGDFHAAGSDCFYAPSRWLVGQREGISDITGDTEPDRFWANGVKAKPVDQEVSSVTPFVAVIGLHRSGSSCLAGVLHKLGVYMGDVLTGCESTGGFEALGLAQVCEAAYPFPRTELGISEDELLNRLSRHVNYIKRIAHQKNLMSGGKYPHLCAMGDELRSICGTGLKIIHINRPLEESILSLQTRQQRGGSSPGPKDMKRYENVQRWLWDQKKQFLSGIDHLTIQYADLLEAPGREIDRMVDYLGISPSIDRLLDAASHVQASMRKHVATAPVSNGA